MHLFANLPGTPYCVEDAVGTRHEAALSINLRTFAADPRAQAKVAAALRQFALVAATMEEKEGIRLRIVSVFRAPELQRLLGGRDHTGCDCVDAVAESGSTVVAAHTLAALARRGVIVGVRGIYIEHGGATAETQLPVLHLEFGDGPLVAGVAYSDGDERVWSLG